MNHFALSDGMLSCNVARFSVKANPIFSQYNKVNREKKLKFAAYTQIFYNDDGTVLSSKAVVNSYALALFRL
jgi:hypothetical protein